MAYPTAVNSQITDAVTQANVASLGAASAMATGAIYQSAAHSTAIVFANAVQAQRQASICAQAAANQGVMQIYQTGAMTAVRIASAPGAAAGLESALLLLVALKLLKS